MLPATVPAGAGSADPALVGSPRTAPLLPPALCVLRWWLMVLLWATSYRAPAFPSSQRLLDAAPACPSGATPPRRSWECLDVASICISLCSGLH